MKLITIVTPCYNEELNVKEIYARVKHVFESLPNYSYEYIFIDNASTDNTVNILREMARVDEKIKVIVNARNFGGVRSQFHGLLQGKGDATIYLAADLQDPPELIKDFIQKWEEGYKIAIGVKPKSRENKFMFLIRKFCYNLISKISDTEIIRNFTGFGLYDKAVIDIFKTIDDRYPFFRGLVSEVGFKIAKIEFEQPKRLHGKTSTNFYHLYDWGMLAITSNTKIPLRLATISGFLLSLLSLFMAFIFLILKIIFWNNFAMGVAPILIGVFAFSSIQLFFIGLLGEYVISMQTQLLKRPLIIEQERINFG